MGESREKTEMKRVCRWSRITNTSFLCLSPTLWFGARPFCLWASKVSSTNYTNTYLVDFADYCEEQMKWLEKDKIDAPLLGYNGQASCVLRNLLKLNVKFAFMPFCILSLDSQRFVLRFLQGFVTTLLKSNNNREVCVRVCVVASVVSDSLWSYRW